jgi:hypothetical protein
VLEFEATPLHTSGPGVLAQMGEELGGCVGVQGNADAYKWILGQPGEPGEDLGRHTGVPSGVVAHCWVGILSQAGEDLGRNIEVLGGAYTYL